MPSLSSSDAAFAALARIFSLALTRNCKHADLDALLGALRALKPQSPIVETGEAQLHILREDWIGALHMLRQMDARGTGSPVCTALQGWCLHSLGDPEWRRPVSRVLWDTNDARALAVVGRFLNLQRSAGTDAQLRAEIAAVLGG